VWWHTPISPVQREEEYKFMASLGYIANSRLFWGYISETLLQQKEGGGRRGKRRRRRRREEEGERKGEGSIQSAM
jgi:hypothetical protein